MVNPKQTAEELKKSGGVNEMNSKSVKTNETKEKIKDITNELESITYFNQTIFENLKLEFKDYYHCMAYNSELESEVKEVFEAYLDISKKVVFTLVKLLKAHEKDRPF